MMCFCDSLGSSELFWELRFESFGFVKHALEVGLFGTWVIVVENL